MCGFTTRIRPHQSVWHGWGCEVHNASFLMKKDWQAQERRALSAPEIVAKLVHLPGWILDGDGEHLAIQKTFHFDNYLQTISFVNAVAFIAERHDHHPVLNVHFSHCVVRFQTHDVQGISNTDFACAQEIQAWGLPR
jgi:4a-hydroxytetrahydrobiopterin dehydratase